MADNLRTDGPRVRRMSDKGVAWLVKLEGGVKLRAYADTRGIPTLGVGQTTLIANGGERRVTLADSFQDVGAAVASFRSRLKRDEVAVDAVTRDDITQTEFDAFCSARYNIGNAFDRAVFVDLFNRRKPIGVVAGSLRVNWHRGEKPHELDERRACETDLLTLGIYRAQRSRAEQERRVA